MDGVRGAVGAFREGAAKAAAQVGRELYEAREEGGLVGRTGWDMVAAVGHRVRTVLRWFLVLVGVGGIYWLFGPWALSAAFVGIVAFFLLGSVFLRGRFQVVDVLTDNGAFDTFEVGIEAFKAVRKEGGMSPVYSSAGTSRFVAEEVDWKEGTMRTAWISALSTFRFFVDIKTHRRLLKVFERTLDWSLDKIGYAGVLGKLQAKEVLQAYVDDYEGSLKSLGKEYAYRPDVPHEVITELPREGKERKAGQGIGEAESEVGAK